MQKYEVEVKSLLGSPARANQVRNALKKADPKCSLVSRNKQLNHYFEGGTLEKLAKVMKNHLGTGAQKKLADFATRLPAQAGAKSFSVRTRDKDSEVFLVVKASVGDDTSENGIARMEIEEPVSLSLDALDKLILSVGFVYQAKWSREREEYKASGMSVTLDKNAGYGWLAEFERVVGDEADVAGARADIKTFMDSVGATELPQDRLERMFAYYNKHWREYYGTEKIFVVE